MLFISRTVEYQPMLVSHSVAMGIGATAAIYIQQFAPDMRIGPTPNADATHIRLLIHDLLDDTSMRWGQIYGLRCWRLDQLQIVRFLTRSATIPSNKQLHWSINGWLYQPFFLRDGQMMLHHTTGIIDALEKSADYLTYYAIRPAIPRESRRHSKLHLLAASFVMSPDYHVQMHFRALTDRRLAAAALAIRWYTLDHHGQFPQSLTDLTPKYLPSAPLDPFTDSQPLRYDPHRRLLWSVGENQTDDNASEIRLPSAKNYSVFNPWTLRDRVVHLTPTTASTRAAQLRDQTRNAPIQKNLKK
jgi:hypothetical protein